MVPTAALNPPTVEPDLTVSTGLMSTNSFIVTGLQVFRVNPQPDKICRV